MSLKPCLNLCSWRWLKPNLTLVNIFIPNGSLILKIFLSTGVINLNKALRKTWWLLELRMFGSSLFHSIMTCGKKEILKYLVLQENRWKILGCLWEFPIWGSKWWLSDWKKFIEQTLLPHPSSLLELLKPKFCYKLSREEPLIAPVATLYCTESILSENDALEGWS